ncbi:hypothetical protein [Marinifilum sp.]|uniref:hypothetical protein n=1 Tax=Marinifilum sp. TaxID=2033137 RepID=UPI003BA95E0B
MDRILRRTHVILIKGEGKLGGAQHNERALIVATEDNTIITYKNNTKIRTLANAGDFKHEIRALNL